jgi:hypothetical protein
VTRADWIDAINREHVLAVAHALGLEVQKARGAAGGSFACPACAATRRHPSRSDPRLAVGVRAEGRGWRCFQCDATGDQLHLVAIVLIGRRWTELDAEQKSRVRAWVQEWTRTGQGEAPRPRLAVEVDAPPSYPPADEVFAFWQALSSIEQDRRIAEWLERKRGLNVAAVAASGICRALPHSLACPGWAAKPAIEGVRDAIPWSRTAYRAIFPMFDAQGAMRNLLARYAGTPQSERAPKSRAAAGYQRRGLVLASRDGCRLLRGRLAGERLRVVIAEGEMDVLAFATGSDRGGLEPDRGGLAILGIVSGSWTAELAARIPDGARVLIATHNDRDGEKYSRAITETLIERMRAGAIRAERWSAR